MRHITDRETDEGSPPLDLRVRMEEAAERLSQAFDVASATLNASRLRSEVAVVVQEGVLLAWERRRGREWALTIEEVPNPSKPAGSASIGARIASAAKLRELFDRVAHATEERIEEMDQASDTVAAVLREWVPPAALEGADRGE